MSIQLQNVIFGYHNEPLSQAFNGELRQGEITCFLGPNGVGKTTLFKTILGLQPLLSGKILIAGKDSRKISRKEFANLVGYVPQSHSTPFAFKALDVVLLGSTARLGAFGVPGSGERSKAYEAMERLGIAAFADKIFTELSGGERQMVMIARALLQEPSFILLDEPAASLDFGNQAKVLQQLKALARQGIGIAMTTHAPEQAFLCEGQAVLFGAGEPALMGTVATVLTSENLSRAYGLPVAVIENQWQQRKLIHCTPII